MTLSAIAVGRPVAQTAPAQIPACLFRAPGSSEVLVSASGLGQGNRRTDQNSRPHADSWPWQLEMVEQIVEALPGKAAALTPPVDPFPQCPHGLIKELAQSITVAGHPIVVVIPTELQLQRWK